MYTIATCDASEQITCISNHTTGTKAFRTLNGKYSIVSKHDSNKESGNAIWIISIYRETKILLF